MNLNTPKKNHYLLRRMSAYGRHKIGNEMTDATSVSNLSS